MVIVDALCPGPFLFPRRSFLPLARTKYQGFNDSHFCQKLNEDENLPVSRETARRILRGAKLASPQKRRPRKYRSRRLPRPRFGMMALTDASSHDWLEGRGPRLTISAFRTTPPNKSSPRTFNSNPKTPSAICAPCAP